MPVVRLFTVLATAFTLAGCHVDITQQIETAPHSAVVTFIESVDDEAWSNIGAFGGDDPFGIAAAKQEGWTVETSAGNSLHTVTFKKAMPLSSILHTLRSLTNRAEALGSPGGFQLSPWHLIGTPIALSSGAPQKTSIPALLRPALAAREREGRAPYAFSLANAYVNAAAVDSIISVHLAVGDGGPATGPAAASGKWQHWDLHYDSSIGIRLADIGSAQPLAIVVGKPYTLTPILALWQNVGAYGVFDYEHSSPPLCHTEPKYHKAWMFGVGVYSNGAQIPLALLDQVIAAAGLWLTDHPVKCP